MNSLPPFDRQVAQQQVRKVYRGQLTPEEAQQLQIALREQSDAWEQFLAEPEVPHELSPDEADALLQTILQETSDTREHFQASQARHTQPSPTLPWWQGLLRNWQQWAVLPAALVFVVLLALPGQPRPTNTWNGIKGAKGSEKAFIKLRIHRHSQHDTKKFRVIPFEQNGYYQIGDAFLFRFLVIERGYLYLLRQDIQGNLEQLFPFPGTGHKLYEAGHHQLMQGANKPLAYFLDHQGHQTFWLVHSAQPMTWPNHRKKLNPTQQRKLQASDHLYVNVFSR